ncbi:MAG TPA: nuclear transport factor 2 family protein [Gaiellaceae bacterium]|nr:nuclear transport factor 2 family protein [Gaiellaceae bacterium]
MAAETATFEVSDFLEIQTLMYQFNQRYDEGDADGVVALFTPDGVSGSRGKTRDHDAIRTHVKDSKTRPPHLHFTTNVVIEPVSGDPLRARARSCFIYMSMEGGGAETKSFGTYADELVKQDGRWLFKERMAAAVEAAA